MSLTRPRRKLLRKLHTLRIARYPVPSPSTLISIRNKTHRTIEEKIFQLNPQRRRRSILFYPPTDGLSRELGNLERSQLGRAPPSVLRGSPGRKSIHIDPLRPRERAREFSLAEEKR